MPFVDNQGIKLYWDEEGAGEPVLLIMGLSYPSYMWHRTRPALAQNYRTIAFDNRGVGQSDFPPGPYSIVQMASDAAAVLDAAGETSAHVLGVSMGGMIAQEFALQFPSRVRSLVLACTAPGGPNAVRADPSVIQLLTRTDLTPEQGTEAIIPIIYAPATPRKLIDEDMTIRMKWYPTRQAYFAQLHAIFAWEAYSRLAQIAAPTLVLHGDADQLVPPGNAKLIAERIPGAQLAIIPGASHIFSTDQPTAAQDAILKFLAACSRHAQSNKATN